jgi:D-sedoheptulose 7-phosphate isomerase|tara:strand:- start:7497 stop:8006 length:510 start_codon:yes stop_codon:yes gene_type:complete
LDLERTVEQINQIDDSYRDRLLSAVLNSSQVILIGNGGSNSIASHIAVDYIKFLSKKSISFSDAPMITAYMNDYGVDHAYKQFIKDYDDGQKTLVILISSSGNSNNIYKAAEHCSEKEINYITLTGFSEYNNVKRDFGDGALIDYWVDSQSYGVVECVHQIFLHMIINN